MDNANTEVSNATLAPVEPTEQSEENIKSLLMFEEKDWFLSELIGLANKGLEIPITLTIGGALVSGRLISGERYFREFGKSLTSGIAEESLAESLNLMMEGFAKEYESTEHDYANRPMRFIHLCEAKWVYLNGKIPTEKGPVWRGKISSVDGFFIGTLN